MERVKALRIKLGLMGILIEGLTNIFCDNESVCKLMSNMILRLNKKHQAICWHAIREACARGWMRVGKEPTEMNIADLLTKALDCEKQHLLLCNIHCQEKQQCQGEAATVKNILKEIMNAGWVSKMHQEVKARRHSTSCAISCGKIQKKRNSRSSLRQLMWHHYQSKNGDCLSLISQSNLDAPLQCISFRCKVNPFLAEGTILVPIVKWLKKVPFWYLY